MIKLSVIIPVYNVQAVIARCIESILKQTFADFELLLINDGSSDLSGKICDAHALLDSRINVIHQENNGVSIARNTGLDHAKGDFIIFIDSDDWIEPFFFEAYFNELSIYPAQLVYQGFVNDFIDKTTYLKLPKKRYRGNEVAEALLEVESRACLGGACNKIFYRRIIEDHRIRFDHKLSYGEDKIFTLQYCSFIDSVSFLDTCYYHYNRTIETSLSNLHHSSDMLMRLMEMEYKLFTKLNQKFANKRFIEAVKGRYISMQKYILISMYRPHVLKSRTERLHQLTKIHLFMKENIINRDFDRDVPKIAHILIDRKNDLGLRILMFMRYKFSTLYFLVRKTRS